MRISQGFFTILFAWTLFALPVLADEADPDVKTLILGQWCGDNEEWQYRWVHTVNADGTFSTYFETFETETYPATSYWMFGEWRIEDRFITEVALWDQDEDSPKQRLFPPEIHTYEILELTASFRKLYYKRWDSVFVSTRNCDLLLG